MQKTGTVPGGTGSTDTTAAGGPNADQQPAEVTRADDRPDEGKVRGAAEPSTKAGAGVEDIAGTLPPPRSDADRFLEELRLFVADTEALLRKVRTLSGHGALAARAELERRIVQARTGFASTRDVTVDRMHDWRDRTERYVRNDPWTVVAIAAAVGFVLGVLSGRRGRD